MQLVEIDSLHQHFSFNLNRLSVGEINLGKSRTVSVSISQWHQYAQRGVVLPMRIPIHGVSMYPLIRKDRDMVTIEPVKNNLQIGDIVLFAAPWEKERYVLHRLWSVGTRSVTTWGDNCDRPDMEIPIDCVWGKAVLIERSNHRIIPDPKKGMKLAHLWHPIGKCLRQCKSWLYKILRPVWRFIKSSFRIGTK